jgi:hypothetical protein
MSGGVFMKVYSYSILINTGNWGGCSSRIKGYTLNPMLAMVRGFEIIKKEYPDDNCKKKWDFGNYHMHNDEGRNTVASIHNTTNGGTDLSVFVESIDIEDTPDNLEEIIDALCKGD